MDRKRRLLVCSQALYKTDSIGVHAASFLGHIGDAVRDVEAKPQKVSDFFKECDHLRVKVDADLVLIPFDSILGDAEEAAGNAQLFAIDVAKPIVKYRLAVKSLPEAFTESEQALTFNMLCPFRTQNVLNPAHVAIKFALDLLRADYCARDGRHVVQLRHRVRLRLAVLMSKAFHEDFDVVLDSLNQFVLRTFDGVSDLGPNEKRVKSGKDAEHLI